MSWLESRHPELTHKHAVIDIVHRNEVTTHIHYIVRRWNNRFSRLFLVRSGIRHGGILSPCLFKMVFNMKNGVRQGGISSPFLFRFYIKDVVLKLTGIGYGCNIGGVFVNLLCYADDMVLITQSSLYLDRPV